MGKIRAKILNFKEKSKKNQKFLKFFEKSVDKVLRMWYIYNAIAEEGVARTIYLNNKL